MLTADLGPTVALTIAAAITTTLLVAAALITAEHTHSLPVNILNSGLRQPTAGEEAQKHIREQENTNLSSAVVSPVQTVVGGYVHACCGTPPDDQSGKPRATEGYG